MREKDIKLMPLDMKPNKFGPGIEGHDLPITHQTHVLYTVARLAMTLVERWGLVACVEDGESTSGRQRWAKQPPHELVQEACDTAALLWEEFEKRDWLLAIPLPVKRATKEAEEA